MPVFFLIPDFVPVVFSPLILVFMEEIPETWVENETNGEGGPIKEIICRTDKFHFFI